MTFWIAHRRRRQQTRKALQMLALSGVVRPGHVELRYCVPLITLKALNRSASPASLPPSAVAPGGSIGDPTPRTVFTSPIHSPIQWNFGTSFRALLKRLDGLRIDALTHFCSNN